jgi:ribose 1,5-bisphosphokinase PhnN
MSDIHPIARRGLMLVLSSPSGAGKTTISRALLKTNDHLTMSISVTTREPRPGEEHGKDYFFVSETEYQKMAKGGELLEHARVFENFYGTPRGYVEEQLAAGRRGGPTAHESRGGRNEPLARIRLCRRQPRRRSKYRPSARDFTCRTFAPKPACVRSGCLRQRNAR